MNCSYCYAKPFKAKHLSVMSSEVLERAISGCLQHNQNPSITWHGGEPTLAGLDFFYQSQQLIERYRQPGQTITQILQTNATLISPELAQFFAKNGFEIGISLDGPKGINDLNRHNSTSQGSYDQIMRGLQTLRRAGLDPTVIATVNTNTLPYADQVFQFLVAQGFTGIKFSPVYDANHDRFNITSDQWFGYLSTVFDAWMAHGDPEISVSELDEVIAWLDSDNPYPMCSSNHTCINWVSIDPDGTMYPCSYFRANAYGNILDTPLQQVTTTPGYKRFYQTFTTPPAECLQCQFFKFCGNGCSATRIDKAGLIDPAGKYVYCDQRKQLFQKIQQAFALES